MLPYSFGPMSLGIKNDWKKFIFFTIISFSKINDLSFIKKAFKFYFSWLMTEISSKHDKYYKKVIASNFRSFLFIITI